MLGWLRNRRRQRVLARHTIADADWQEAVSQLPLLHGLNAEEMGRLRTRTTLFLHEKHFSAAGGMDISQAMRLHVAIQAALPILNLGWDFYRGWVEVILYPEEFLPVREYMDETGVVHVWRDVLMGEAWSGGPVILSWADAEASGSGSGINVVLHEFAHKLDMLNGDTDGLPPLHEDMRVKAWAQAFKPAYDRFCARVQSGDETAIDPYAAESPGEFFAVLSEVFFETPSVLHGEYPEVYGQMRLFYRQDPLARYAR
jgi:MtfA peptidase